MHQLLKLTTAVHLTDQDLLLLVDAIARHLDDKRAALAIANDAGHSFTPDDFGIPALEDLSKRLDAAYQANT